MQKNNRSVSYVSSEAVEVYLCFFFIALGVFISPLTAYFTSDWVLTISPMILWLMLIIPTRRGVLAEHVVDVVFLILSKWDDLIGVDTHIKGGLILFSGMLIGLVFNVVSTFLSLIAISCFS